MRSHIRRLLESAGFTPRQLFAALQGAWLEPKQGLIWQENTGITPTTTGGQTIGLMLDQSQGAVLGPELVTNGTFDTDTTGWTSDRSAVLSVDTGRLKVVNGPTGYGGASQYLTNLVVGKIYFVSVDYTHSNGSGFLCVSSGAGANGTRYAQPNVLQVSGKITTTFTATTTAAYISVTQGSTAAEGAVAYFDNVSVRQILGNHAYQATAANRPVLGRRYNLLTYSEDFANAVWVGRSSGGNPVAVKTPNYGIAPDGTQTACRVQLDVTSGANGTYSYLEQTYTSGSTSYTQSCWVKTTDGSTKTIRNLTVEGSPVAVTGAWTKLVDTRLIGFVYNFQFLIEKGTTSDSADLLVWHPDVRLTSNVGKDPAYQRITTATDYDYGQYPAAVFDTNDFLSLSLPAINVRRNLLTYSEDFTNAAWDRLACTVTPNTHLNPWGEPKASTLSFSSAGAQGIKRVNFSCSDTAYSVTNWIKSGSSTTLAIYARDKNNNVVTSEINVATGAVLINAHDVTVTATGNGFWRITTIHRSSTGTLNVYLGPTTIGTLIFGAAQYELGSVATDYQKITDWTSEAYSSNGSVYFSTPVGMSSLNNQSMGTTYTLPALSSDIYSWMVFPQRLSAVQESRLSLYFNRLAGLPEPDYVWESFRRNLLVWSEDFSNGAWLKINVSVATNTVQAPDGSNTADTLTCISFNSGHNVQQGPLNSSIAQHSLSQRFKFNNNRWVAVGIYDTAWRIALFDIENGIIGSSISSGITASITSDGNGWYVCKITYTPIIASIYFGAFIMPSDTAFTVWTPVGTEKVYLWGSQMELGTTATNYQRIDAGPDPYTIVQDQLTADDGSEILLAQ